jgi:diadenosine tetraphosphate (Ap4A) HIT family hydrolase
MARAFRPDKVNVGALGNVVRQLHVHHVARTLGDAAWPGPVWGHSPRVPRDDAARTQVTATLFRELNGFEPS